MTSRTSLIISGSSADVGSSNSMTLGSIASARAMATRCCWPPESWAGYLSAWSPTPTRSSSSRPRFSAAAFVQAADLDRAERDVLEHGLVGEQVERLEDHADVGSAAGPAPCLPPAAACRRLRSLPELDRLEPVDRPAQRRLARAGRADHDDDLAVVNRQVDVLEDVQVTEVLVDLLEHDQRFAGGRGRHLSPSRPARK